MRFIIASKNSTKHIKNLQLNPNFSGTVALETKNISMIKGIQFSGVIKDVIKEETSIFFKTFPYAKIMKPTLWSLHIEYIKFTDNKAGFGNKKEYKKEQGHLVLVL